MKIPAFGGLGELCIEDERLKHLLRIVMHYMYMSICYNTCIYVKR